MHVFYSMTVSMILMVLAVASSGSGGLYAGKLASDTLSMCRYGLGECMGLFVGPADQEAEGGRGRPWD